MTVHKTVLDAFDGTLESQPLEVVVRVRDVRKSIFVGFGEIRVPVIKDIRNLEEIGKEYECKIKRIGDKYIIIPNVVGEIIKKDGLLCSVCDEHRKKLRDWMYEYGAFVIRKLLEG